MLREHPEAATDDGQKFNAWAIEALNIAEAMDPMNCSLDELLRAFAAAD
jgi:hypothetical protein